MVPPWILPKSTILSIGVSNIRGEATPVVNIPLFLGLQPSQVVQDSETIHNIFRLSHEHLVDLYPNNIQEL